MTELKSKNSKIWDSESLEYKEKDGSEVNSLRCCSGQKQFIVSEAYINGTHTHCAVKYGIMQNYWLHKWML